ncbi:AtaL-like protein [Sutterella sp.]|uniref:AtaL-like protein n=1 Tax=Sutterella sp. TaxID=1981025 RepID=UPI0026E0A44E|nr:AtaL-like protein [Sutterella sp.]MDO5530383.1 DUF1857 family protein [Sutterella sp.]
MKFHEHIVRASLPELPFRLSRAELAAGIADFARHPDKYIQDATGSRIVAALPGAPEGGERFEREISFGSLTFRELVEIRADGSCRARAEAEGARPGSDFVISIEEPEPEVFFVRFTYHEDREVKAESVEEKRFLELRRLAYELKDRDVVSKILDDLTKAFVTAAHA